jgi:hypothetical protein
MASSNLKPKQSSLVCRIRAVSVHDTPEERVRQQLLAYLMGPFGAPRSLIGVEVSLKTIVTCTSRPVPNRRLDIVCFSNHQGSLNPFLIIECKASKPLPGAISQINGYNFFVGAPVIALAWPGNILVSHHGKTLFEGQIYPNKLKNREFANAESPRFDFEKTGSTLDIGAVFSESKMGLSALAKTDSSTCLGISSLPTYQQLLTVVYTNR